MSDFREAQTYFEGNPDAARAVLSQVATKETQTADLQQDHELSEAGSQPEPVCEESPYPRYAPGTYEAECLAAVVYRDPRFRAWKARLKFSLLPDGDLIYGFFHLGGREKPHAGPGSEYRRAWIIASGAAPRKRQELSSRTFKRKIFQVRIDDVTARFDQRPHPEAVIYSTVREILSRTYP